MADFFRIVDSMEMIRLHVDELEKLDTSEQQAILEIYQRVRRDLRLRLANWLHSEAKTDPARLGEPARFTAQKLRGTFLQIEQSVSAFGGQFLERVEGEWYKGSLMSVNHLQDQINHFQRIFTGAVTPINLPGLKIAIEHRNFLVNNYQASIDRWSQATRQQIALDLQESLATQETAQETITRIMRGWEAKEWQLRRIVRTEMHSIYNVSKLPGLRAASASVPRLKKALYHPMDHRTAADSKFLKGLNPIIPVDEPFRYVWDPGPGRKKYPREFMAPPDRPNDRATLIPYSDSWS